MSIATDNISLLERIKIGDRYAENELVNQNIKLVHSITRRFSYSSIEYEDLFQTGCIGLLKAARAFDPSFNTTFSTYAVPVIIGEIKRHIRDDGIVKVSRVHKENSMKIQAAVRRLENDLCREPTTNEIANEVGIPVEDVIMAMDACAAPVSLDEPINDEDDKATFKDSLGEDNIMDIVDNIAIKSALENLCAIERGIIVLRYFKDYTQQETAKMLNITQVQVSRTEKKVLKKMRNYFV